MTATTIEPFSGEASSNWDEWFVHFENCAAVNSWESNEEKLKWICVRLTGKAQTLHYSGFQHMPTRSIVSVYCSSIEASFSS